MPHLPKHHAIRRCFICGFSTHKGLWDENKICPVCGEASGFVEVTSGGLRKNEIAGARERYLRTLANKESHMPTVERELG